MRRTLIKEEGHPNSDQWGWIFDYRLRASKALGKPLPPGVVIHHHYDRSLVICEDEAYHNLLKARTDAYAATGDPKKRKCHFCKQYDDLSNLTSIPRYEFNTTGYQHQKCYRVWKKEWWIKNKDRINKKRREERSHGSPITLSQK
jgi:hypothetical protein